MEDKLEELLKSEKFRETCQETLNEIENGNDPEYESEIVEGEEEIIRLSNKGYDSQKIDEGRWLMRKEIRE
ncbi:hypothetical protein AKJ41_04850 [candidate division MSBL1 archaeon SCGC-AAA259O05]|uniref:Uncharacterized protein n=2 Tax=candidate division MSBL1 TaxID=215777 RepID=A0A133V030_9EURY|nr:hypothetical protein AKJ57_05730 [candidate division MSBL1 archaeon SCGC-AAA259A05]KXA99794.1 hypothetical protein AKJ41_04850 [candidate division MSBL1 archaeon SCGC-AAA259O05]